MNRKLIIFITIIIGIVSFYGFKKYAEKVKNEYTLTTQISSRIFDFNSFDLKVDSNLNLMDFKVTNLNSGKTIFENGKSQKGIKNEYGYCYFELLYKEQIIYEFGHFKKNNWETNDYELIIELIDKKLKPKFNISSYENDKYVKKID